MRRSLVATTLAVSVAGCHLLRARPIPTGATLQADSAQYTVRLIGPLYRAAIGFRFTNHTGSTLSANYCNAPTPPALEKQRADGGWVLAYSPVVLLCLTLPPFRIPDGGTYQGTVNLAAAPPGKNFFPVFGPDSVPGIYRLRWVFRAGSDPDDRSAQVVEIASPPFRFITP